jgi:hypothetical protein
MTLARNDLFGMSFCFYVGEWVGTGFEYTPMAPTRQLYGAIGPGQRQTAFPFCCVEWQIALLINLGMDTKT